MVGFFISGMQKGAYEDLARSQLNMFKNQLEAFRLHVGSYPTTTQGLESLRTPPADLRNPAKWRGPYASGEIPPPDPWDNPYQYELVGPSQYRIFSFGADGAANTEDDIIVTN
jgi:general secretion pathway protein G